MSERLRAYVLEQVVTDMRRGAPDGDESRTLSVRIEHPDFDSLIGKRVRVTIEVLHD